MKNFLYAVSGLFRRAVEREPALFVSAIVLLVNGTISLTVEQQQLGQALVESFIYAAFPAAVRPMVYSPATVKKLKQKIPKSGVKPL